MNLFGRKRYKWPPMLVGENYIIKFYDRGDFRKDRVTEVSPNGLFRAENDYTWRDPAASYSACSRATSWPRSVKRFRTIRLWGRYMGSGLVPIAVPTANTAVIRGYFRLCLVYAWT